MAPGKQGKWYDTEYLKRDLKSHLRLTAEFDRGINEIKISLRWVDKPDEFFTKGEILIQDTVDVHHYHKNPATAAPLY